MHSARQTSWVRGICEICCYTEDRATSSGLCRHERSPRPIAVSHYPEQSACPTDNKGDATVGTKMRAHDRIMKLDRKCPPSVIRWNGIMHTRSISWPCVCTLNELTQILHDSERTRPRAASQSTHNRPIQWRVFPGSWYSTTTDSQIQNDREKMMQNNTILNSVLGEHKSCH